MAIAVTNGDYVRKIIGSIMNDYTNATDIACIYIDVEGKEQSPKYNFTGFCQFMRSVPCFREKCHQCDLYGGIRSLKDPAKCCPYRCHAGLVDFSVPVVYENRLTGFIVAGQMSSQDERIQPIQEPTVLDEDSYEGKYLKRVPEYTYDEIMSAYRVLSMITACYFPYDHCRRPAVPAIAAPGGGRREDMTAENRPEVRKAVEYIRRNLGGNLSLRSISEEVFLSESYLSKLFKKEMGMNLMEYINVCRVEEAERILQSSRLPVDAIGRQVGFRRPSYFCKIFKKITGTTPHAYRKQYEER